MRFSPSPQPSPVKGEGAVVLLQRFASSRLLGLGEAEELVYYVDAYAFAPGG